MSQMTKPSGSGNSPRGRPKQNNYGGHPPGGHPESNRPKRARPQREEAAWIPKTNLGKKVDSGEITSLEEIMQSGGRIQEAGIIKKLLPDLKTEVIDVGLIQKMTANGQSTRLSLIHI